MFTERSLVEKLELFVDEYISMLMQHHYLPIFVLQTIHRNPDFVKEIPQPFMEALVGYFKLEIERGRIKLVDPMQFIPSVMGMCVFPFVAKPVLKHVLMLDEDAFTELMTREIFWCSVKTIGEDLLPYRADAISPLIGKHEPLPQ